MLASLPPRGMIANRSEVDHLRSFCRRRAAWRTTFRRQHELPLHRAPTRRILLLEGLDVRNFDGDDRIGDTCGGRADMRGCKTRLG